MKLANTKSIFSDIPALCNLYSGPSLQTESNALSRSAIIVMPYLFLVIALFIFFTSGRITCDVFLLFWYAYRLLFWKNCDCSSKLTVSCRMILSQILQSVLFFKNWDSLHARLNSHYEAWSYKKESTKKITGYRKSA